MPTEKQLAANRANATKSTGPRTAEGKARSARNACTHGFTASSFAVVRLEDLDEIARLKQDAVAVYQPVNAQEMFALEQIALTQQNMFRIARLESGLFTNCLDTYLNTNDVPLSPMSPYLTDDIQISREQNRNYALADGFDRMVRQGNSFGLILRYKAQAERLYRRAVEDFSRLKALRNELPNEAISDLQPEEKEPDYMPPNKPVFAAPWNPQPAPPQPAPEPAPENTETEILPAATSPGNQRAQHRILKSAQQRCTARATPGRLRKQYYCHFFLKKVIEICKYKALQSTLEPLSKVGWLLKRI